MRSIDGGRRVFLARPTRFAKLFTGIAVETPVYIKASKSRRGFEDTTPEDTPDADYGRLLDQAVLRDVLPET